MRKMTNKVDVIKNCWWGFREAFRFPVVSSLYIILIVGIVENKSLIILFMLLIMLNYVCENKD